MERSCIIDLAQDASALIDVEPLSFSSAELGDGPEALLEEHFKDIVDDEEDIPEVCFEETSLDITDEEADIRIHDAWLEENFISTIDHNIHTPEAKVRENFMDGANRDVGPLSETSFLDQVVLVPIQQPFNDRSTRKVNRVIPDSRFNVVIELLSAAFDQLSSVNKPGYALIAMLTSVVAAITCIIELANKAGKEKVQWRWESKLPWFYYSSPSHRRFGNFPEMMGSVFAVLQTIMSAVA
ncbi:hypothetical protein DITRI_Ditri06bG0041600 [Diplodiscus trichospermus]